MEARVAKARVVIADDHTLVAEAFKRLLEPECEVVGTVADGRALLRLAPQVSPDLVLVDLNMPLLNGLDASEQLKQALPKIKIIVLTMNEDPEIAAETMRKWASGYLLKKSAGSELLEGRARRSARRQIRHSRFAGCDSGTRRARFPTGHQPNAYAKTARSSATSCRRPHNEGSRGDSKRSNTHGCLSQIPHHAGFWAGK